MSDSELILEPHFPVLLENELFKVEIIFFSQVCLFISTLTQNILIFIYYEFVWGKSKGWPYSFNVDLVYLINLQDEIKCTGWKI